MKKKVVRYTENDIERLVERILNENLPKRERERHATQFAKSKFEPYEREEDIMNAFGPYREDIPPNVISYLRKNPRRFIQRLVAAYGMDKMLDFIGYTHGANVQEAVESWMGGNESQPSIFDNIESDLENMPTQDGMDYLDEVINYCINRQEDLANEGGYNEYMSDKPERPKIKQEPNPSDDDKEYWSRVPKQSWQPKQRPIVRQEKNPKL
jgi:hypothetical protein